MRIIVFIYILLFTTTTAISQSIEVNRMDDFTGTHVIRTQMYELMEKAGGLLSEGIDGVDDMFDLDNIIDKDTLDHGIVFQHRMHTSMVYNKNKAGEEVFFINISLSMKGIDIGCLSEYDGQMMLLTKDDEVLRLAQYTDTDCGGTSRYSNDYKAAYILVDREHLHADNVIQMMRANFNKIMNKKIKRIRIYATNGYYDFNVKKDKQSILMQHANSIYNEISQ